MKQLPYNAKTKTDFVIHTLALVSAKKILFMILVFALITTGLHAQMIRELDTYIKQSKSSSNPVEVAETKHLETLLTDLQPTVYISDDITVNGESDPVCADVNAGSVEKLRYDNPLFDHVELITIRIESPADLNFKIDLSMLKGFKNLKYFYFLCEFKCTIEETQNLFIPAPGITVYYKVSIPS